MIYNGLLAGWSRGFTLLSRSATEAEVRGRGGAEPSIEGATATRGDLIAALRFPMAPGWILQRVRRPVVPDVPLRSLPRGCG